jgi:hypothetical protein
MYICIPIDGIYMRVCGADEINLVLVNKNIHIIGNATNLCFTKPSIKVEGSNLILIVIF